MRTIVLFLLIAFTNNLFAQKDTISTDVIWPLGLAEKDNYLYVAEADINSISRIDILDENFPKEIILTDIQRPNHLHIHGNDLYFTEYNAGVISKIDLSQLPNAFPENIVTGLINPKDLFVDGNDLYFTESNKISKFDLTTLMLEPVLEGLNGPIGFELKDEILYYSEYNGDRLSKLDLSQSGNLPEIIIDGIAGPLGGIELNGSDLYYSEFQAEVISKIDISDPNATPVVIDDNFESSDILFVNNDLYMSDNNNNLIIRYSNLVTTSLPDDLFQNNPITVYPNPTEGFIYMQGLEGYENQILVVNSLGKTVKLLKGKIADAYNITDLQNGIYFLLIEDMIPIKVIKH